MSVDPLRQSYPFLGFLGESGNKKILLEEASRLRDLGDCLVVIGIGGVSYGARLFAQSVQSEKRVEFISTPSDLIPLLEKDLLESSHFLVLSESGETVETIATLNTISELIKIDAGNTTLVSGSEVSSLKKWASNLKMRVLEYGKSGSGVYSSLGLPGLLPAFYKMDSHVSEEIAGKIFSFDLDSFKSENSTEKLIDLQRIGHGRYRFFDIWCCSQGATFAKWVNQLWSETFGSDKMEGGFMQMAVSTVRLYPHDLHGHVNQVLSFPKRAAGLLIDVKNKEDRLSLSHSQLNKEREVEESDGALPNFRGEQFKESQKNAIKFYFDREGVFLQNISIVVEDFLSLVKNTIRLQVQFSNFSIKSGADPYSRSNINKFKAYIMK
jgi:hypothetical protein